MDLKSDEGIFLGYSTNNRAYRVFNSRTKVMIKSINVIVDDSHEKQPNVQEDVGTSYLQNDDSGMEEETVGTRVLHKSPIEF